MPLENWLKVFHLFFVISWFAVLFYLPRLFVYHAGCDDAPGNERFKIMERKLYRGMGTFTMIGTLIFGGWLFALKHGYYLAVGWMHAKLLLVVLLIGYHHWCGWHVKQFARDQNRYSHVYFRWFNEVPIFFLLGILILVLVKPF
ncbi:CopD family protein [Halioxenophilus sp. WMMB6]|uniref:CopD family protein n=1 Tax=Halioxenophilus sp. WMMB6 TaxID=3073815 RepID=UPI00295ED35F|nr:CopD family protein [Halioxenophilus sp. WMMB6]